MFHVTPSENLSGILNHGLAPAIGPRSKELGELTPMVYLFTDMDSLDHAYWLEDYFHDDELVVVEVDTTGLVMVPTFGDQSWEHVYPHLIPADRIKVRPDIQV